MSNRNERFHSKRTLTFQTFRQSLPNLIFLPSINYLAGLEIRRACLTIFPILLIFQLFWWSLFWLSYCFINYSIFLIANPFFREKTSLLKYQSGQADVQKHIKKTCEQKCPYFHSLIVTSLFAILLLG